MLLFRTIDLFLVFFGLTERPGLRVLTRGLARVEPVWAERCEGGEGVREVGWGGCTAL